MAVAPTSLNLDEAVRQWLALGSGLSFDTQVIDASQPNTPSPVGLYATALEVSEVPDGTSFGRLSRGDDNAGVERSRQSITATYSLQWYRTGARDTARRFQLWAHSPEGVTAAADRGLTLYATGDMRRLDAVDDLDWEERAGIDVTLGYVAVETFTVPLVESVDVEVHLDGETA